MCVQTNSHSFICMDTLVSQSPITVTVDEQAFAPDLKAAVAVTVDKPPREVAGHMDAKVRRRLSLPYCCLTQLLHPTPQLAAELLLLTRGGPAICFPPDHVAAMTDNFHTVFSTGSFGAVYVGSLGGSGGGSQTLPPGPQFKHVRSCRVAVKRIHPALLARVAAAGSGKDVDNQIRFVKATFQREIEVLTTFTHPNIVRCIGGYR